MGMFPFRELEVFDAFILDGRECDKVGSNKYIIYDELWEPKSLEVADPNMMVELVEGEEEERYDEDHFFLSLLDFLDGMEQQYERAGEKLTIESLKQFAEDFLNMPEDP
jgi:hypothetical protein